MTALYLLRHGEAERANPAMQGDRARRLTPQGHEDIQKLAVQDFSQPGLIDRIYHSPYTRARQTADIVAATSGARMITLDELTPSGSAERVVNELAGIERPCLVVSHLPLIAEIAERMLGDQRPVFYQGTCLQIQLTNIFQMRGELVRAIHPGAAAE